VQSKGTGPDGTAVRVALWRAMHVKVDPTGTPFVSFFDPPEMLALARDAGFAHADHVSAASLSERYFAGRADGLRPSSSEEMLVPMTEP
jgi:hypothetical protein